VFPTLALHEGALVFFARPGLGGYREVVDSTARFGFALPVIFFLAAARFQA
jgi:hypothetical protein